MFLSLDLTRMSFLVPATMSASWIDYIVIVRSSVPFGHAAWSFSRQESPHSMHDLDAQGNQFFKCDFCASAWEESRPMVEGHRGSLICAECLSMAYAEVILLRAGTPHADITACTLCLMHREDDHWKSPLSDAAACAWCITKSADILEKDPDAGWKRPNRQ